MDEPIDMGENNTMEQQELVVKQKWSSKVGSHQSSAMLGLFYEECNITETYSL